MGNKIAIVTGGTSGVGKSIVRALAREGWEVHFIGRNQEKGKAIEDEINSQRGAPPQKQDSSQENGQTHPYGQVHFVQQDLSRLGEVKSLATKWATELERLDLLVNVAGVVLPNRQITPEGIEKTFAIGYLSAFVLATTLAPLLEKSPDGRIANVAGSPRQIMKTKLNFDDLYLSQKYGAIRAAFSTIHAKTVMTQILSNRYKNISVNSFHPGLVRSELGRDFIFPLNLIFRLGQPFISPESKTGIYVCLSPEVKGKSGWLYKKKKGIKLAFDQEYCDRLWEKTTEIVNDIPSK